MSPMDLESFLANWEQAKGAASDIGWDGDFRGDPVVVWLPGSPGDDFVHGFAFKQDNNGTAFKISPVPLRHLES